MPTAFNPEGVPAVSAEPVVSGTSAVVEERRASQRIRKNMPMKLAEMGCMETHHCTIENISEGGLCVRVPANASPAVGQRCELSFPHEAGSLQLSGLVGETCYATVVRTELLTDGARQVIGAGLRFDRPLFL